MNKVLQYIKRPINIFLLLANKGFFKYMSDKKYMKIMYNIIMNNKIDFENPKTFNEKLNWLKLYDRNPEYTKMVDKYEAKRYVANIIGKEYVIPTLGIYDKFDYINFQELPNQFVIKCTHDSGSIIICKDKRSFDYEESKKRIDKALKKNFYYQFREWPYKNVKPRIIIEKYINQKDEESLVDYKLMCFNGNVKCTFVCSERNSDEGTKIDIYDKEWNKMSVKRKAHQNSRKLREKPKNYDKMIEISENFSKNIPFLRVDFYEIDEKLYFSEFTFYPAAGLEKFEDDNDDIMLGKWLELPNNKEGLYGK